MYSFAQPHNILILPATLLPLVDEQSDDLFDSCTIDEADVDGEEEAYYYREWV